jgi:hypothetical protein
VVIDGVQASGDDDLLIDLEAVSERLGCRPPDVDVVVLQLPVAGFVVVGAVREHELAGDVAVVEAVQLRFAAHPS